MIYRIIISLLFVLLPGLSEAQLYFSTGVPNGSYQSMANDLKQYYSNLELQPSNGSLENFDRLIAKSKKTELTIVQEDVLVARQFKDMEEGVDNLDGVRLLVSLGLEEIHVIVRQDSRYKSLKDLKSKRVNTGLENSGTYVTSKLVGATLGISWRESNFSLDSALKLLNEKKMDAIFFVGAAPVAQLNMIADSIPIKFLPMQETQFEEIYYKSSLRKQDYPFLEEDVPTFAVRSLLVANINKIGKKDKPELDKFLIAIRDNFKNLQSSGHPKWKEASFNTAEFSWPPYEDADEIFFPKAPLKPEITLLSGVKGGSYEQFANDIMKISKYVVGTQTSYGSMDNFRQLYLRDKYYVTFLQQDVLIDQQMDDVEYETNYTDNIRVLLPLANEDIHLITLASSPYKVIKDLKNKKVGVGTINQGTQVTAKLVKQFSKGRWDEVEIDLEDGLKALEKKEIDALFFVGSAPLSMLKNLPAGSNLKLLHITASKLKDIYTPSIIKAGSYPWLKEDVATYSVVSVLATNIKNETPEQKEYLEGLVKDIYTNIDQLKKDGHVKWSEVNFDLTNIKWPVYEASKSILQKK
jgi:TRAP transporter TAXI family solute receptor